MVNMKNIFITGASRGIGRATAIEFGKTPSVFYTTYYKDFEAMLSLHKFLKNNGNINFSCKVDVSNRRDINNAVSHFKSVDTQFGIDVLINNAGIVMDKTLKNMSDEEWDRVIAVNLTGMFNITKAVLPYMNAKGCIINISSVIATIGNYGQTNYSASKSAVIGFTKSLAYETAKDNIRVNCLLCGPIETDMTNDIPEKYKAMFKDRTLLKRFGKPEEVAKFIRFLSIEGTYCTAGIYEISGGFH
jgi:NAD(P)-dependent dehydrogenase (short-subunit alcohol dehydrogenase family)